MNTDYSNEIKVIHWSEHPSMKGVKEVLEKELPGWEFKGPYCPGKRAHHTFKATKGDETKWVHVHDTTHALEFENAQRTTTR